MAPRVSIGLPVFNGQHSLRRALDSLLAQDFDDLEIVISDNASDDLTQDICAEYVSLDSRIRYHRNEVNLGLMPNFNRVFELSAGEYFQWAAHDDWWHPRFLSRCVQVLDDDPNAVLCATGVAIVDERERRISEWRPVVSLRSPRPRVRLHRLFWTLGETHALFGLMRASALRQTQLLQGFLGADRVLLAELSLLGSVRQLPELLHFYTVDSGARRGRRYSVYNDPANRDRLPLRTWRLIDEHIRAIDRAELHPADKLALWLDVLLRFGVKDSRRLLAELYHSGRIILSGARP